MTCKITACHFTKSMYYNIEKSWKLEIFVFLESVWDVPEQRHYFVNKGPSSQGYGFSSDHVWMQELGYKES